MDIFQSISALIISILAAFGISTSVPDEVIPSTPRDRMSEVMVYESDAESADECSSFEKFDEANSVCYFECESEAECTDMENQIKAELESWEEPEDDATGYTQPESSDEEDMPMLAQYSVKPDETITFAKGKDTDQYHSLWKEIAELSPDMLTSSYIETFTVMNDPKSDTLAFVDDQDSNGKWRVAVNLPAHKEGSLKEQKSTLIHELGHIISLNTSQLTQNTKCKTLSLDEGCMNTQAPLNTFWVNFWKSSPKQTYNEQSFVTEYAATSEVEDFAESFTAFVLSSGEPTGASVKDKKVAFMYSYPELMNIRNSMRSSLAQDIIRAKKSASSSR